jgi:hypothetical protein
LNAEATLFVYDIIKIDSHEISSSTVLLKDYTDPFRYYIYHKAGVHSVFMPWLEEAKLTLTNIGKKSNFKSDFLFPPNFIERFDSDDYSPSKVSEISNLICTKPIENG